MKQFDLNEFIAFCREKGDERYEPADLNYCALAQFGFPGLCDGHLETVPQEVYNEACRNTLFIELADCLEGSLR